MHQRILASLMVAAVALPTMTAPAWSQGDAQIQHYQRKYISFFYPQDFPLNDALAKAFQTGFPRFDYHLASTSLHLDFATFLQQTRSYEQQVAGDIAAGRTVADPRFGDKVVSWSETQQISKSAYVFVPVWDMDAVRIDGPYPTKSDKPLEAAWTMHAVNNTSLNMQLWSLAGEPQRVKDIDSSWTVTKDNAYILQLDQIIAAASRYNEGKSEDDKIDLQKSLSEEQRKGLLAELRKNNTVNSALSRIEGQDPYQYMMADAVKDVGYSGVIGTVQRMPEFLIRAELDEPDMAHDRVTITLGEGETPQSLGISLDSGYKIVEYVKGSNQTKEVGYVKVRELGDKDLISQPIIVGRDFELGDQVVEYPKSGVGINLRGGVSMDPAFKGLNGGGGALDLDFNIGPALGVSELYFSLSGGYYLGGTPKVSSPTAASVGLGLVELGLQKKWFWRQLIFALGLRGGASFGENDNTGGGATALAGLHWQATPDFGLGFDAGWRQYTNLSGPLFEGFIRFDI
ncbi:MAG TPA: hypothetical protein V6D23_18930 [Candidatus Obscuribacterales bacterium]